jgi:hypothetical protein
VVNLPQLNPGYACDILKKQTSSFLLFHIDDRSGSSSIFDMIIVQALLGEIGIVMNFNDHKVTWDNYSIHYSNERQRYSTLSSVEALIEVYINANEPQTLRDKYYRATKILDDEYKPASLDDTIKTCENLHVEEQHQLKILLHKYENLFDGGNIRRIKLATN